MKRLLSHLLFGALVLGLCALILYALERFVLGAALFGHSEPVAFTYDGRRYELLRAPYLAIVALTPLLAYGARHSLADLPWQQRLLSLLFRSGFFALLALALARPVTTSEVRRVCTVFLVDVSDSVTDEALEEARSAIRTALNHAKEDDQVRLVTFAERPRLERLSPAEGADATQDTTNAEGTANTLDAARFSVPEVGALRHGGSPTDPAPGTDASARAPSGAGTDIQAALELGYGLFPPGYLKRALLFSDGVETRGDLLAEANRAQRFGVRLHTVPYTQPPPGEVAIRRLVLPPKVAIGEPFEILAELYASRANTARARLYQGEMLNGLDGVRELQLQPGLNEVRFKSVVRFGGEVDYALKLDAIAQDRFPQNNQITARLEVPGRPTVLYVAGQPQRASYLTSALTAQQFEVDVRPAAAFPASLAELSRYDMLIVGNVPAEKLGIAAQDLIERYVRDVGGGLLFSGGEQSFGLGGWSHTTMERILPVRMDAERKKEMPSVAMQLVVDRSGSMSGLPMEMAKAACIATVGTLQGDDLVGVIAFDSTAKRYVKLQPARYRSRIQSEISQIQAGGGTVFFPALDAAYQDLSVVQARKKHVILLTDGRSDSQQGIRELVQAMVAEAITVTTVGLGDSVDADALRMIAEHGGGRYHHVPDPNNLPRIFTRETEMISRQAAVEEWFPVTQTSSADFLKGIAINTAPLLHGYVVTQLKGPPAQQILASDQGEPILARWRVGLGHSLAWTSDFENNWAVDWLRWPRFSVFVGQLVREHMRKKHDREIAMQTRVVGDRIHAVVDAFTPDERFDNGIVAKLFVQNDASKQRTELAMTQTAPGRYEAQFALENHGSFSLRAEHLKEQADGSLRQVGVSYGNASHPYPREYASFEPDLARLTRAAMATGGSTNPPPETIFDPGDDSVQAQQELWSRAILAALVLFLLDLLTRRVRLFDRKFAR